jgi:hypothetical protein
MTITELQAIALRGPFMTPAEMTGEALQLNRLVVAPYSHILTIEVLTDAKSAIIGLAPGTYWHASICMWRDGRPLMTDELTLTEQVTMLRRCRGLLIGAGTGRETVIRTEGAINIYAPITEKERLRLGQ